MFVCIEELIPEKGNVLKEVDVGTMSFMVGFIDIYYYVGYYVWIVIFLS